MIRITVLAWDRVTKAHCEFHIEDWSKMFAVSRVLAIHEKLRPVLQGKPFQVLKQERI